MACSCPRSSHQLQPASFFLPGNHTGTNEQTSFAEHAGKFLLPCAYITWTKPATYGTYIKDCLRKSWKKSHYLHNQTYYIATLAKNLQKNCLLQYTRVMFFFCIKSYIIPESQLLHQTRIILHHIRITIAASDQSYNSAAYSYPAPPIYLYKKFSPNPLTSQQINNTTKEKGYITDMCFDPVLNSKFLNSIQIPILCLLICL